MDFSNQKREKQKYTFSNICILFELPTSQIFIVPLRHPETIFRGGNAVRVVTAWNFKNLGTTWKDVSFPISNSEKGKHPFK